MGTSKSNTYFLLPDSLQHAMLLLCLLMISIPALAHKDEVKHLELGIFPHLSEKHLQRAYTPIALKLSKVIGQNVHFDVEDNLDNFHEKLEAQEYDIVMLQPFDYVEVADEKKYQPLVAQNRPLKAIFAVKEGSHLQKTHNLLGRDLYFPPRSTAVSYLARYHLKHSGIDLENDLNTIHERTHVTCLQKVIIGLADACATAEPAVVFIEEKIGIKMRSIGESLSIPHTLFAVKSTMNSETKSKLLKEILSWALDNEHKDLLNNARLKGFKAIKDSDYDIVRTIKEEVDNF